MDSGSWAGMTEWGDGWREDMTRGKAGMTRVGVIPAFAAVRRIGMTRGKA